MDNLPKNLQLFDKLIELEEHIPCPVHGLSIGLSSSLVEDIINENVKLTRDGELYKLVDDNGTTIKLWRGSRFVNP